MFEGILYISYGVLVIVAILMIRQLAYAMKHFTPPAYNSKLIKEADMPSVTVCIPARNEMHALTECLQRVINSDYEKLEIIVLDDASADNTSSLIKSFAKDGVRFVEGKSLPAGWLGRNHALQGLLREASGSYILFMDVDTRIAPNAVSNIVRYALSQNAGMVSVLPRREDSLRASVLFSTLRFFWEVIFHSKASPATVGNAWLINRELLLNRFNGFEALKNTVQPESQLSASLATTNEYRFLMSTSAFGVAYEKKWRSQLVTSTRLIFPLLERKLLLAAAAIIDLFILLIPVVIVIDMFVNEVTTLHIIGLSIAALYAAIYGWYLRRVWNMGSILGAALWPVLVLQEIILVIASIYQYKRRTVRWKGRDVLSRR
jgi:glycosyltransferase involved in cell wall biosynthesis